MAKLIVVCVRDSAIGLYNRPFVVQSIGQAVRSFGDECVRDGADNPMKAHPADFELYHTGEFDEETGLISSLMQPTLIARAVDYVNRS